MSQLRWEPKTLAQAEALDSLAEILFYGGAAGGGKTDTLLMDAVQEYFNPNLHAIIFRESFPQLAQIIRRAYDLYRGYPYFGWYNKTEHCWNFPVNVWAVQLGLEKPIYEGGARIRFAYLRNDDDVHQHQGQEYSFIGFDESTHFSEFQFRYMLSRLRSTDQTLRLRVRLASNPGNEGHAWHMKVFIGEKCWHCYPNDESVRTPFVIYRDAQFTDGTPVDHTTQFIPANVTEHELFGPGNREYIRRLRLQRPNEAKALLEGCWALFEGQYFNCFEPDRGVYVDDHGRLVTEDDKGIDWRMVVPRGSVDVQWWWSGFGGGDYGYGSSQGAFIECVRTPASERFPSGRVYVIAEYLAQAQVIPEWARSILDEILLQPYQQQRLKILAMYLGPDSWRLEGHGEGHSLAAQANEVLREYGLHFQEADNDRVGGWQLIYSMLKSGELVICDNCTDLQQAIVTRIYDPKKNSDIKKVPGDKLDDIIDALRYTVYSFIRAAIKPAEMRIAEAMARASDPTNAMIARRKIVDEIQREKQPIFIGAGARRREALHRAMLNAKNRRKR